MHVSLLGGNNKTHDSRFCKQIILVNKNFVGSLSFSGIAYLDNKPTDHFLAEVISGIELENPYSSEKRVDLDIQMSLPRNLMDLINRINSIQKTINKIGHGLEISIQVFQFKRSKQTMVPRLIDINLIKNKEPIVKIHKTLSQPLISIYGSAKNYIEKFEKLIDENYTKEDFYFDTFFADFISKISKIDNTIGTNIQLAIIDPVNRPHVILKYINQSNEEEKFWYTPYIISFTNDNKGIINYPTRHSKDGSSWHSYDDKGIDIIVATHNLKPYNELNVTYTFTLNQLKRKKPPR